MIELPNPRNTTFPVVPDTANDVEAIKEYLTRLVNELEDYTRGSFDNVYAIVSTGTSGSFIDSLGNTVTVVSGIITGLA